MGCNSPANVLLCPIQLGLRMINQKNGELPIPIIPAQPPYSLRPKTHDLFLISVLASAPPSLPRLHRIIPPFDRRILLQVCSLRSHLTNCSRIVSFFLFIRSLISSFCSLQTNPISAHRESCLGYSPSLLRSLGSSLWDHRHHPILRESSLQRCMAFRFFLIWQ